MQKRVDFASINTKNGKIKEGEINTTYSLICLLSYGEEKKFISEALFGKSFFSTHTPEH